MRGAYRHVESCWVMLSHVDMGFWACSHATATNTRKCQHVITYFYRISQNEMKIFSDKFIVFFRKRTISPRVHLRSKLRLRPERHLKVSNREVSQWFICISGHTLPAKLRETGDVFLGIFDPNIFQSWISKNASKNHRDAGTCHNRCPLQPWIFQVRLDCMQFQNKIIQKDIWIYYNILRSYFYVAM